MSNDETLFDKPKNNKRQPKIRPKDIEAPKTLRKIYTGRIP